MNFKDFIHLYEMAYPESFSFEKFENISSYSGKVKYAAQHLKRLGSGSSRVIFQVDDEKVLKIAKNVKGLAQNLVEADWYLQNYDVIAKVFKRDEHIKDNGIFWIEMELAKKVSPKRFYQLTGLNITDIHYYLMNRKMEELQKPRMFSIPQEKQLELENNEWFINLYSMILDYDMESPGDFSKINSYGEVIRNGKPTIVLVDFGLSKNVWYNYYKR